MTTCQGCGTAVPVDQTYPGDPGPAGCSDCPPSKCETCGGINDMRSGKMCACWVSVADLPLADVKAIFARDGTFNVGADGSVTVA